jgi:hypothetical protein
MPGGHADDEIGVLVKVANQQFENIATEIQQRRNAENRLTDYLGQLETSFRPAPPSSRRSMRGSASPTRNWKPPAAPPWTWPKHARRSWPT